MSSAEGTILSIGGLIFGVLVVLLVRRVIKDQRPGK